MIRASPVSLFCEKEETAEPPMIPSHRPAGEIKPLTNATAVVHTFRLAARRRWCSSRCLHSVANRLLRPYPLSRCRCRDIVGSNHLPSPSPARSAVPVRALLAECRLPCRRALSFWSVAPGSFPPVRIRLVSCLLSFWCALGICARFPSFLPFLVAAPCPAGCRRRSPLLAPSFLPSVRRSPWRLVCRRDCARRV
ncbi:hypothetical protein U9M48_022181 [Paspalum notatum var. saurae]|uniref:Uncharacterized protein n=1 Tax=Paspalum notatum var. saurae TaxID=547442 RepID=A0AAQ3WUG9_PASNO